MKNRKERESKDDPDLGDRQVLGQRGQKEAEGVLKQHGWARLGTRIHKERGKFARACTHHLCRHHCDLQRAPSPSPSPSPPSSPRFCYKRHAKLGSMWRNTRTNSRAACRELRNLTSCITTGSDMNEPKPALLTTQRMLLCRLQARIVSTSRLPKDKLCPGRWSSS